MNRRWRLFLNGDEIQAGDFSVAEVDGSMRVRIREHCLIPGTATVRVDWERATVFVTASRNPLLAMANAVSGIDLKIEN